jgi:formylglycine-generating enzyme required for sulfatase activity
VAEREVVYHDFLQLMKREPGAEPKNRHNELRDVLMANCTWFDCIEFCNLLSQRDGLTPAYQVANKTVTLIPGANGYRLPTEAEWEFACRAGTTSLWYFGMTAQAAHALAEREATAPGTLLRSKLALPNAFGLMGMYAAASEWCWDRYSPGYFRQCAERGVIVDPTGPELGDLRVIRGGSQFHADGGNPISTNSAGRHPQDPIVPAGDVGFGRLVLPISAKRRVDSTPPLPNR